MIQTTRLTRSAHSLFSVAEAAAWCSAAIASVDGTVNATDQTLVADILRYVTEHLEQELGRALLKGTFEVAWDLDDIDLPDGSGQRTSLVLRTALGPVVPLLSVESVTCYDSAGVATVLSPATDYWVRPGEHAGRILLRSGIAWPADLRPEAAVVAALTAGYGPTEITLTLATVLAAQAVTINGLVFTAHATVTTPAARQFSIAGTDAQDATELAACINAATYGVPGVSATAAGAVVTIRVSAVNQVALAVAASAATITVTVTETGVPGLLKLCAKELVTYFYRNPGTGLVINPESGAMRDATPHPGVILARARNAGYGRGPVVE